MGMLGSLRRTNGRLLTLLGVALAVGLSSSAAATTLVLSDFSSDTTPASQLDATVTFDVVGNTLTVSLTNQTGDPAAFNINEIYFNSSDSVTDLMLTSGPAWSLSSSTGLGGPTDAGKFGIFDWALKDANNADVIMPLETSVFELSITGVGPFDMSDFGTEFSTIPSGDTPALVAAKFIQCVGAACVENDDSAFGATIPEPGTAALLLLGMTGLAFLGRNRG